MDQFFGWELLPGGFLRPVQVEVPSVVLAVCVLALVLAAVAPWLA